MAKIICKLILRNASLLRYSVLKKNTHNCFESASTNTEVAGFADSLQGHLLKNIAPEDHLCEIQLKDVLLLLRAILQRPHPSVPQVEKVSKVTFTVSQRSLGEASLSHNSHKNFHDYSSGLFSTEVVVNKMSYDKGIQSCHMTPSCITDSKLIQTRLGFDIMGFKIGLIRHIRALREDVVTLRELLVKVEVTPSLGVTRKTYGRQEEFEYKFAEARVRAAHFAAFNNLRKSYLKTGKDNKKKNKRHK